MKVSRNRIWSAWQQVACVILLVVVCRSMVCVCDHPCSSRSLWCVSVVICACVWRHSLLSDASRAWTRLYTIIVGVDTIETASLLIHDDSEPLLFHWTRMVACFPISPTTWRIVNDHTHTILLHHRWEATETECGDCTTASRVRDLTGCRMQKHGMCVRSFIQLTFVMMPECRRLCVSDCIVCCQANQRSECDCIRSL